MADLKEIKIEFECLPDGGQGQEITKVEVSFCDGTSKTCKLCDKKSELKRTWPVPDKNTKLEIWSGSPGCVVIGDFEFCWD